MSIATLDRPVVSDIPVRAPEQEQRPVAVRCYLCGELSALVCDLCGQAVCKACYREDYGPCLIERDWCIPCANKKAAQRDAAYAGYRAQFGRDPVPLSWKRDRFLT